MLTPRIEIDLEKITHNAKALKDLYGSRGIDVIGFFSDEGWEPPHVHVERGGGIVMRFMAAIMLASAIRRILRHLGLPSDPVELAPARAPPELDDAWAC